MLIWRVYSLHLGFFVGWGESFIINSIICISDTTQFTKFRSIKEKERKWNGQGKEKESYLSGHLTSLTSGRYSFVAFSHLMYMSYSCLCLYLNPWGIRGSFAELGFCWYYSLWLAFFPCCFFMSGVKHCLLERLGEIVGTFWDLERLGFTLGMTSIWGIEGYFVWSDSRNVIIDGFYRGVCIGSLEFWVVWTK